jgi:hypothetical protein
VTRRSSSFGLTARLRWSTFWASWRLSRTRWQQTRARRRTELLGRELDSSLLREKELAVQASSLAHRLQEMDSSRSYRESVPLLLPLPPSPPLEVGRLLWVENPLPEVSLLRPE